MSKNWMSDIIKNHGIKGSDVVKGNIIATPSPSLNWAAGNGGFVAGKTVLLAGPESSGKSLIMYLSFIEILKQDSEAIVVLFDSEWSFNADWFTKLGGDPSRVALFQTKSPTGIFDFIYTDLAAKLKEGAPIKAIGIDSLRAIVYPGDNKKESTALTMGGSAAKYLEGPLKKVTDVCASGKVILFLVQQVYMELDQYKAKSDPFIIPGGIALRHMSDYIIIITRQLQQKNRIEDGTNLTGGAQTMGHRVKAFFKKNKMGNPFRLAEFTLHYNLGIINIEEELYNLAKSLGVVYHPINPDTGKVSPQMWVLDGFPVIKSEAVFKQWFVTTAAAQSTAQRMCDKVSNETSLERNKQLGVETALSVLEDEVEIKEFDNSIDDFSVDDLKNM
jgi:RecA/RadA recombinase